MLNKCEFREGLGLEFWGEVWIRLWIICDVWIVHVFT